MGDQATIIIRNTEARLHLVGDFVRLLPGANPVPVEAWERAKLLPVVRWHVEQGHLVEEARTAAVGRGDVLLGMTPAQAIRVVGATLDMHLLKSWHDVETRGKVKRAICEQAEKVADASRAESTAAKEG